MAAHQKETKSLNERIKELAKEKDAVVREVSAANLGCVCVLCLSAQFSQWDGLTGEMVSALCALLMATTATPKVALAPSSKETLVQNSCTLPPMAVPQCLSLLLFLLYPLLLMRQDSSHHEGK